MTDIAGKFFAAADSRNPDALLGFLAADVAWTFGNMPTVTGHAAVKGSLIPFFEHVIEMRHRITGTWTSGDCLVAETAVFYKDRFGRSFEFPGCTLLFRKRELISEVRVFIDNHALFLPPSPAAQVNG
jgi:ketosteroid isomerase-like protein